MAAASAAAAQSGDAPDADAKVAEKADTEKEEPVPGMAEWKDTYEGYLKAWHAESAEAREKALKTREAYEKEQADAEKAKKDAEKAAKASKAAEEKRKRDEKKLREELEGKIAAEEEVEGKTESPEERERKVKEAWEMVKDGDQQSESAVEAALAATEGESSSSFKPAEVGPLFAYHFLLYRANARLLHSPARHPSPACQSHNLLRNSPARRHGRRSLVLRRPARAKLLPMTSLKSPDQARLPPLKHRQRHHHHSPSLSSPCPRSSPSRGSSQCWASTLSSPSSTASCLVSARSLLAKSSACPRRGIARQAASTSSSSADPVSHVRAAPRAERPALA